SFLVPVEGVFFSNQASAGSNVSFAMQGGYYGSAFVAFQGSATAGYATYICQGATGSQTQGGYVAFESGQTSADHGTFNNEGTAASGGHGGFTVFNGSASAGSGKFMVSGGKVGGAGGG